MNSKEKQIIVEKEQLQIRKLTRQEIRRIYKTYMKNDFPPNELRPLSSIEQSIRKNRYICYGIFLGKQICAYGFFIFSERNQGRVYLLDYFAVEENLRGKGIGSYFLSQIKYVLPNMGSILVEVENPAYTDDEEERNIQNKRVNFYLQNGLADTGVTAWLFFVEYIILELPGAFTLSKAEIKEVYKDIYESMIGKIVAAKMLKIH